MMSVWRVSDRSMNSTKIDWDRSDKAEEKATAEIISRFSHLSTFILDYARTISEKLLVWLVVGKIGAIALTINLAIQIPSPFPNNDIIRTAIICFLCGAGGLSPV
mgnify:CR=1 FL=1